MCASQASARNAEPPGEVARRGRIATGPASTAWSEDDAESQTSVEGPTGRARIGRGRCVGALLRGDGLYWSHLAEGRRARERWELARLAPKRRGPRPNVADPRDVDMAKRKRELAQTEARLEKTELTIDAQDTVSPLLGSGCKEPPQEDSS